MARRRSDGARRQPVTPPPAVPWWAAAALALVIVATYLPALRAEFVRWDDPEHVSENARVTERDGLVRSWRETRSPGFYPITYTTFWFEWRAAGGAPWLFHLDNVLMHAASAVLIARLGVALGLTPVASWLAAALWALHPMQVASVAWVSERKNVLYVLLYLASLSLFAIRDRSRTAYVASVCLFACALLSKAPAVTLPAAIVLIMWARQGAVDRGLWRALVPYVALAIGAALGLLSSVPTGLQVPSLATRLALPPRILAFYVTKFLWPTGLLPMYPRWPLPAPAPVDFLPWLGVAAVAAFIFIFRSRLPRLVLFGIGFFLVNVALVLGVSWFTYFDHSLVADHLAYLPSLGLAFAAVSGATALASAARVPLNAAAGALGLWAAVLGIAAWRQIPVWYDSETLWTYTIARNPDCATCQYNLGLLLEERGDLAAAAAHYERSLRIRADSEPAINLGNVRFAQGRVDEARALYQRATEIDSKSEKAWYNLGMALARQDRPEEAIARYREAIRLAPGFADAHRVLGDALLQVERSDEARTEFETALRLAPGDRDAERGRARVAVQGEHWEEAVTHYERALAGRDAKAKDARTHRELAAVLDTLGRPDDALRHYEAASRLAPEDAEAVNDLATALAAKGRVGDAVSLLAARLQRTPDVPTLAGLLAWIHATTPDARWRDGVEAVRLAEHACALTDYGDPDLLDTLAAAYAAAGRFDDAVKVGRRAVEAASGNAEQAADIRARLASYEARQPYTAPR